MKFSTRKRKVRTCPWCHRNDPRLDHNYKCKSCGVEVKAHWCSLAMRNEIERPLHKLCICPKCAVKEGLIKSIKRGLGYSYEWIVQKPKLETEWGER